MSTPITKIHSYNVAVAEEVGINAAVIFNNICFWVEQNYANERNFINEKYWTYNTVSAFHTMFPEMTPNQISYALQKLEQAKYIESAFLSSDTRDRTKWYTVCDFDKWIDTSKCNSENSKMVSEQSEMYNINNNINNKTDIKHTDINKTDEVHTLNKFNGEVHTSVPEKQKPSKNTFDELKAKEKDMVNRFSGICESHIDDVVIRDTVRNIFERYICIYNLYTCKIHPILTTETLINVCIALSNLCNDYNHFDIDDIYKPDESGFAGLDNMLSAHFARKHRKDTNYSITHFANAEYLGKLAESVIEY